MSSAKLLLCDLCVILLFASYCVIADLKITKTNEGLMKGKCSCGGFSTTTPEPGTKPLLSQSPDLLLTCDDEGESTCKKLCMALATAARAQGPALICERLKNATELKLSAFYKICDKTWTYIQNMTEERPLCCEDRKHKKCGATYGGCTCGGFPTQKPEVNDAPLLSQAIEAVTCDMDGDALCKEKCASIAQDKKIHDNICSKLKTVSQLKLSAFYKPCEKPWMYIENITSKEPICCDDGQFRLCGS